MDNITIIYNEIKKEFKKNTTYYEIGKDFNMPQNTLGVKVNNEVLSLSDQAKENAKIEFIDYKDVSGIKIYKSGLEFIFEIALKTIFPELDINYQHSVPRGFLAEIVGNKTISQDDLIRIKSEMAKIISENRIIKKINASKNDVLTYYKRKNELEKYNNIQHLPDKVITLYELSGVYNNYYSEMPYSTGVITKYDIVFLGRNRLVFVMPSTEDNENLPEYVHYDNIINAFSEGKSWLSTLNMQYVESINSTVGSGKIKEFISSSELVFNLNILRVVMDIANNRNTKFILIAGPSSSGKTTTSRILAAYLRAQGLDPISLSIDDFFLEREESPKDEFGNYNFEGLDAIDLKLFNDLLGKFLKGTEVKFPTYNFITGRKEYDKPAIKIKENSIVIIEGLHALNDDLLPSIENKLKYKIYLSPFIPLNIDRHNYISTLDLRLIRRIIRDNMTRNYDVNQTIENWQIVRDGEEKYIFPFIHQANAIINTALPYEVGVLKVYAEPLLRSVDINSSFYAESRRLLNFLKVFYPIPSDYVGNYSILKEFIGGNRD